MGVGSFGPESVFVCVRGSFLAYFEPIGKFLNVLLICGRVFLNHFGGPANRFIILWNEVYTIIFVYHFSCR